MKFVDVIIPLAIGKPLTYGVPIEWQGILMPGMRVEIQLGKTKLYSAIVYRIHDNKPEAYQVKPIRNILDQEPIVTQHQLEFWDWIASYYMCNLGAVMQAALPAHFKLMNEYVLVWNDLLTQIPSNISINAQVIAEALIKKGKLTIEEIRNMLDGKGIAGVIDELLVKEIVYIHESLDEKYKPKVEKLVSLTATFEEEDALHQLIDSLSRAPKQLAMVFRYLEMKKKDGWVSAITLMKSSGTNSADLNNLIRKGIFYVEEVNVDRIKRIVPQGDGYIELSPAQATATQAIQEAWQEKQVVLLHGVTGSGKTMVYVQLIKDIIAQGKQVLMLLPEIALTTHVVSRLEQHFGSVLGVYHSRFSDNERIEIWNKVQSQEYKVILGARSSIWLPFQDLALIIVDEEHEPSYKQVDPAPRFQARDAAIMMAHLLGAKLLLGSATPSVETFHNVQIGKYGYVTLTTRYSEIAMPQVEVIPANHLMPSLSNIITKPLLEAIAHTLHQHKQVILFQNKRGYAPVLLCNNCGWVAKCKNCDVSLTYHKSTDKLHCHYCSTKYHRMTVCEQCGWNKVSTKSFGTEKVEEELNKVFPTAAIGRLDWDTVKGKNGYQKVIADFESGKIQILVGTQMVVKGLDFQNVNLVGVLSADSILGFPDYRVHERAFQLLEQVAGRAGRKDQVGKVMIQAYKTDHPVLQQVVRHDYEAFYQVEIGYRKDLYYPPFIRMIKVLCRHMHEDVAAAAMGYFVAFIQNTPRIIINGPSPALVSRVKNQYIYEVWIKMSRQSEHVTNVKKIILDAIDKTKAIKGMSNVFFACDVDP